MPEFTRYAPPAGSFIRTAQLGTTREWVEPFMAQIEPYLANARQQSNYMPLGVTVAAALPEHESLLLGHSLVGLLEPLAIAFGLPHLRYVAGAKVHGLMGIGRNQRGCSIPLQAGAHVSLGHQRLRDRIGR